MMTKKQFCLAIVDEFASKNNVKPENITEEYITQCSRLAVAMEFLGRIPSFGYKKYAESRGGVLFHYAAKIEGEVEQAMLTTRELIALLPD
jgi:hypothetical protein